MAGQEEIPRDNCLQQQDLAARYPVGAGGYKIFTIEVHYDNPEGKEGIVDSSGFHIYFSKELRQHGAGYMEVGDKNLVLMGHRLPSALSKSVFDCIPTRSQSQMNTDEVTVIGVSIFCAFVSWCYFF